MTRVISETELGPDPLLHAWVGTTPQNSVSVEATPAPTAPVTAPEPEAPLAAPRPAFVVSNQNLVVSNGGSARGMTAVIKKKNGRDVQFVTVNRGNGNCQSLTHHPIFHNEAGEEHIHHKGAFRPVKSLGLNIIRREMANRG